MRANHREGEWLKVQMGYLAKVGLDKGRQIYGSVWELRKGAEAFYSKSLVLIASNESIYFSFKFEPDCLGILFRINTIGKLYRYC